VPSVILSELSGEHNFATMNEIKQASPRLLHVHIHIKNAWHTGQRRRRSIYLSKRRRAVLVNEGRARVDGAGAMNEWMSFGGE